MERKTRNMNVIEKPLTNLQIELLKLYSQGISEKDLTAIKRLIANYFANQASNEMDKLWEKNKWTNETMDDWLKDEQTDK